MNAQNLPSLASFSKASSYQICRLKYGKDKNMTLSANHLQKLCLSLKLTSPSGSPFNPQQVFFLQRIWPLKLELSIVPYQWLITRYFVKKNSVCVGQVFLKLVHESHVEILYLVKSPEKRLSTHFCMSCTCCQNLWVQSQFPRVPNLHCRIYDSQLPMTKKLFNYTIQLLCKLINVNNLLYPCKYNAINKQPIMWCFHNSICNRHCIWIWSRKISICFDTNANIFTKLHKQQIHISFLKIWTNMIYIIISLKTIHYHW